MMPSGSTQVEESLPIEEGPATGETGDLQLAPTSTLLSNLTSGIDWSSILCYFVVFDKFPVVLLASDTLFYCLKPKLYISNDWDC